MTILVVEPKRAGIHILQKLAINDPLSYVEGITVKSVHLEDDTVLETNIDLNELDSVSANGVSFKFNKQFGLLYLTKENQNVKHVVLDVTVGTMQK